MKAAYSAVFSGLADEEVLETPPATKTMSLPSMLVGTIENQARPTAMVAALDHVPVATERT